MSPILSGVPGFSFMCSIESGNHESLRNARYAPDSARCPSPLPRESGSDLWPYRQLAYEVRV
jgi:hypothetical protein